MGAGIKVPWVMEEWHNNMVGISQDVGSNHHYLALQGAMSPAPTSVTAILFFLLKVFLDLQKVAKIIEFMYNLHLASPNISYKTML